MTKLLPYLTIMAQGELFPKCHFNKPVRSAIEMQNVLCFILAQKMNWIHYSFGSYILQHCVLTYCILLSGFAKLMCEYLCKVTNQLLSCLFCSTMFYADLFSLCLDWVNNFSKILHCLTIDHERLCKEYLLQDNEPLIKVRPQIIIFFS